MCVLSGSLFRAFWSFKNWRYAGAQKICRACPVRCPVAIVKPVAPRCPSANMKREIKGKEAISRIVGKDGLGEREATQFGMSGDGDWTWMGDGSVVALVQGSERQHPYLIKHVFVFIPCEYLWKVN